MEQKNKGFTPIAIVLIIIAVLAIGGIAYYAGKSSMNSAQVNPMYPDNANQGTNTPVQNSTNQVNTNGQSTQANNCTLTQPQAQSLVLSTWGGCTPDKCGSVTVTVQQNTVGQCVVTAIYGQLRDDSASSQKKEAIATYLTGWTLGTPTVTWACQLNRGHSNYSNVPCH